MSHNILKNDRIESTEATWHKLEELKEEIVFTGGALDWKVSEKALFIDPDLPEIPDYKAIVREDLNLVLNVSKQSYEIIQNSRVWETINNSLAGLDYQIVTAGSLGNCKKVFVCVKLNDAEKYLVNGDDFKNFLVFTSSHDGSLAFNAYDTSVRVVCQNTLNWSLKDKGCMNLKVFHTKNSELKIHNMEETIEGLLKKRIEFYESYKYLMEKPMSSEQAEKIISGFLGSEKLSTRAANQTEKIVELFQTGKGNNGETVYDLLGGVTEYFTHFSSNTPEKQFSSSEFGSGSNRKLEFLDVVFDDDKLEQLAKRGEKLLKEREELVKA